MHEGLLAALDEKNLDGFFLAKKPNVRYISGYTGDDSYLLVTKTKGFFLTDPRYTEQAAKECPDYTIVEWRSRGSLAKAVAALAGENGVRTLGFEPDGVNFLLYDALRAELDGELTPAQDVVERLRSIKTEREIAYLRAACEISCRAFNRILGEIRVGVTEKELAAKLSLFMVQEGADTQPYGNILISGSRTSLLHGIPSERAIGYGDFVLMDFGCQYNGYLSDMTRTVVVGKADSKQREVYELEKGMLEDALKAMKAGARLGDVYTASAKRLQGSPYLPYHYKGIGHGIGMFVHELPFIRPDSDEVFRCGNVQTIEPGIYIPGWGGVRIEDQVLITPEGYENLISVPHDLIEL